MKAQLRAILLIGLFYYPAYGNECLNYLKLNSFYFPNSTYHQLQFSDVDSDIGLTNEIDISVDNVLSYLNKVTLSLGRTIGGVKSVLYPAIGSDAITAFRAFESAQTVIGIDSNPFVSKDQDIITISTLTKKRLDFDNWIATTSVNNTDQSDHYRESSIRLSIAEIVISDLKKHYPDLVIHEIIRVDTRPINSLPNSENATNGIIRFSKTPNGPIIEYIHVQLPLEEPIALHKNKPEFLYLIDYILDFGFQGLIAKAAMGTIFLPPRTQEFIDKMRAAYPNDSNLFKDGPDTFEQPGYKAIKHLVKNGGIFIDGDGVGFNTSDKLNAKFISLEVNPSESGNEWIRQGKTGYYKYKFGYSGTKIRILLYTPETPILD